MYNKYSFVITVTLIVLSAVSSSIAGESVSYHFADVSMAKESRILLSSLLYEKCIQLERSGNLPSAARLWANLYNINFADESIKARTVKAHTDVFHISKRKYIEALDDMENGRDLRALLLLQQARDLLAGLNVELRNKITSAISLLEGRNNF
jgi:hypothetical protein